jgi:hypothetical protein
MKNGLRTFDKKKWRHLFYRVEKSRRKEPGVQKFLIFLDSGSR